jgi:hypothetical protein
MDGFRVVLAAATALSLLIPLRAGDTRDDRVPVKIGKLQASILLDAAKNNIILNGKLDALVQGYISGYKAGDTYGILKTAKGSYQEAVANAIRDASQTKMRFTEELNPNHCCSVLC